MKAVNHAYTTAKPDGLTITGVGSGVATGPILGMPAVRYDLDKLIYLGFHRERRPLRLFEPQARGL
jgi:hypothetical protein